MINYEINILKGLISDNNLCKHIYYVFIELINIRTKFVYRYFI